MAARKRGHRISVRFTDEEYAVLMEKCRSSGLCIEALVRKWVMGEPVKARPPDVFFQVLRELSAIGNNINQAARIANQCGLITRQQWNNLLARHQQAMELLWERV